MPWLAMLVASALVLAPRPALTQSSGSWLLPSPISLVLTVGRWLSDAKDERVYYIQVQARGRTETEARHEAFKKATEEAVGSLVATETVVIDQTLARREIISYSSAFIDRSQQIQGHWNGDVFTGVWDIWIRRSTIADRLLIQAKTTQEFDGSRIQIQVDTLNYVQTQGERLIGTVLADYPHRAYAITDSKFSVKWVNRQALLTVDFNLNMSPKYLDALFESLRAVSQANHPMRCCHQDPYLVFMRGNHNRWLFNRWEHTFVFANRGTVDLVMHHMLGSEPAVLLTLLDGGGRALHRSCHRWPELDGVIRFQYPPWQFVQAYDSGNKVAIDTYHALRARLEVYPGNVEQVRRLDLAVVRGSSCPR